MDGGQLHRLGRRLIELSRSVTAGQRGPSLTPGEEAVLEDVIRHPDSSIAKIHARTGFAQSHVSVSVGRLRQRGWITSSPDPTDRRRIHVRVAEHVLRAIAARARHPVDGVIGEALADDARARRVVNLLDELARLLLDDDRAKNDRRKTTVDS